VLLDEVFGADRFLNEIVWWYYNKYQGNIKRFASNHDAIFWYSKSATYTFHRQTETRDNPVRQIKRVWDKAKQSLVNAKDPVTGKVLYQESTERTIDDVWRLSMLQPADKTENIRYGTQKPLTVAERIINVASDPGDLVADFFCGSGTALVAAERLGRRWIGCDLGRFAIHTTRKRLLNVPDCRPFDIKNLGAYERQRWQQASGNGALRAYIDTILAFYRAEPVDGFLQLHGRKAGRMVHVGATDAPVTIDEAEEVMDEMADNGTESCDLLGWEWEMGLHDTVPENARRRGLDLQLRQIPREVMERQVAEADAVRFFELAYVDLDVRRQGSEASVVLKDFIIPSEDLIPVKVRDRIESWSDLIDYWSVDFDHRDETFHNQWQAYRTRGEPALSTQSDWHEYPGPGRYAIVVKVIDIFGNDTTKLAEVRIK
jgi:adenine-specific DNA-methyltransferase